MKIENLKDLKAVIKLCQTEGVRNIVVDGITIELGDKPERASRQTSGVPEAAEIPMAAITENSKIESFESLTEEQKMFWSVGAEQQ